MGLLAMGRNASMDDVPNVGTSYHDMMKARDEAMHSSRGERSALKKKDGSPALLSLGMTKLNKAFSATQVFKKSDVGKGSDQGSDMKQGLPDQEIFKPKLSSRMT